MNMDCPVCFEPFGSVTARPLVGACGHSICENCAPLWTSCPICRKNGAFRDNIPNFQLIDLLNKNKEYINNQLTIYSGDAPVEGYTKCTLCNMKVSRKTVRLCLDCSLHNKSKPDQKLDPVICCASCCLEGAHAGHKTILHSPVHNELFKLHGIVEKMSQSKSNISALGSSIDNAKERISNVSMILALIKNPSGDLSTFANVSEKFEEARAEITDLEVVMRRVLSLFEALGNVSNNLTGNNLIGEEEGENRRERRLYGLAKRRGMSRFHAASGNQ